MMEPGSVLAAEELEPQVGLEPELEPEPAADLAPEAGSPRSS